MYSVIKFQSPFERLKSHDKVPEISLHKAIITQAVIDATNTSDFLEAKKIEIEAKNWIFGNSSDFITTCQSADITPHYVRKIAREAILLQHQKNAKAKTRIASKNKSTRKPDRTTSNELQAKKYQMV